MPTSWRGFDLARELWCLARLLPSVQAWAYFDWHDPVPAIVLAVTARRRLTRLENPPP